MTKLEPFQLLAGSQACFYIITGLWPIFHMSSFLTVTGPKHDLWLVKTVGSLIVVVGLTLLSGVWNTDARQSIALLGVTSALVLASVDISYVSKRVISKVYLLDAVAELLLVVLWLLATIS